MGMHSTVYRKRNPDTYPATKPLSNNLSRLQDVGQWWLRTCRSNQPKSGLTSGPHQEKDPMPYTACLGMCQELETG